MRSKLIVIVCLIFTVIAYSADKKVIKPTVIAPSYNNFIGKTFVQISEIDSMLSMSEFSTLYKSKDHGITIFGQRRILNKWRKSRFKYFFFTKKVGQQGTSSIEQILDIVSVDMNNYNDSATVSLDECECKGKDQCQTVAIYNRENNLVQKGKKIKPIKV